MLQLSIKSRSRPKQREATHEPNAPYIPPRSNRSTSSWVTMLDESLDCADGEGGHGVSRCVTIRKLANARTVNRSRRSAPRKRGAQLRSIRRAGLHTHCRLRRHLILAWLRCPVCDAQGACRWWLACCFLARAFCECLAAALASSSRPCGCCPLGGDLGFASANVPMPGSDMRLEAAYSSPSMAQSVCTKVGAPVSMSARLSLLSDKVFAETWRGDGPASDA